MRIVSLIILISLIFVLSFSFGYDIYKTKIKKLTNFDVTYNYPDYIGKDKIVASNFEPKISEEQLKRFSEIISKGKSNIIDIEMSDTDYKNLFNIYYSREKKIRRPKYDFKATIKEYGENNTIKKETTTGNLKIKGNYSTQSLKIGLKLSLDKNLQNTYFKGKKYFALRHLTYDVTGVNEKTFMDLYKEIYNDIFSVNPYYLNSNYYWVFFNKKLYGYYLFIDESQANLIKNSGDKIDKKNDCIVKSKLWEKDLSGNLSLSYGNNRKLIMEDDNMSNAYKIQTGDKKYCLGKFRELLTKIDEKDIDWIKENFISLESIYFWVKYIIETNSYSSIHQNFVLVYHNNKWDVTLRDGDLSLLSIEGKTVDNTVLRENGLMGLILDNKDKLDQEIYKKIRYYDFQSKIKEKLKELFYLNFDSLLLDREIWFKYIKKDIELKNYIYIEYAKGNIGPDILKENFEADFLDVLNKRDHTKRGY